MINVKSRITAQGQTSVPSDIRKKLGVGPGAVLEWVEEGGTVIVRRSGNFTSADVHRAAFPHGPPKYVKDPRKEGMKAYVRQRHARD